MNSSNISSVYEPFSPKKSLNSKDNDEIAVLLDNIPELDSKFSITKKIGHGTFSSVYLGHSKPGFTPSGRHHFAIKQIIPTSHPSRVFMELKCLKLMGGKENNIIEALLCLRNGNYIVLVMPYFPHDNFIDYVGTLTTEEISDYLLNLFIALKKVHSFGIIHRDVKPANFLYWRKFKRYALIDFGLAQEAKRTPQGLRVNNSLVSSASKIGTDKTFSSSLHETPRLHLGRQVKRKLATNIISPEGFQSYKKLCVPSPIFSSTSTRINSTVVRRSPRKLPTSFKGSNSKENSPLKSKSKGPNIEESLKDSPSKHTRLAVAFREGKFSTPQNEAVNRILMNTTPKVLNSDSIPTRKSPRKSLNTFSWKTKTSRGLHDSFENLSLGLSRNSGINDSSAARTTPKEVPSFAASLSNYSASGTLHSGSRGSSRRSSVLQEVKTRSGQTVLRSSSCSCYGNPKVCSVCSGRRNQHAPRAGTPGFRAPEVLMRHPYQTTAVDMWSVGVILLSLLSGHYPFFRAVDDLSSLAEINTILGTKALKKAATKMNKLFTSSEVVPPLNLILICEKLRNQDGKRQKESVTKENDQEKCKGCRQAAVECVCLLAPLHRSSSPLSLTCTETLSQITDSFGPSIDRMLPTESVNSYPASLYDLLYRLLDPYSGSRISAKDAISHPFIVQYSQKKESS